MKDTSNTKNVPSLPGYLSWLFPYKSRSLPISTKSPVTYYLFQNKITITFINWFFQGMRGMGIADLIGKLILDIIFIVLYILFSNGSGTYDILTAFLVAHTLNWLVNTHFWDFGRFLGITRTSPSRFFPYLRKLMERVNKDSAPPTAIIIGGLSRNRGFKTTSDVDMIFIRGEGFQNAVKSVLVAMRERFIALICKFPLHLELYDSMESMKKHRIDEVPVILKDVGEIARDWYNNSGREISRLDDYDRQE